MNNCNYTDVKKYFNYLNSSPSAVFAGWWEGTDRKPIKGAGKTFLAAGEIENMCAEHSSQGLDCCLHVTLNETNGVGRKGSDMKGFRVLCVDLDREVGSDEIRHIRDDMKPSMIVESSPGHYHLYWKLVPDSVTAEDWKAWQLGLAWKLGGDTSLGSLAHTIRVPGFERTCKDGSRFVPRIVWSAEPVFALTAFGVGAEWPAVKEWGEKGSIKHKELIRANSSNLKNIDTSGDISEVLIGDRNNWLFSRLGDACFKHKLTESEARALGLRMNGNLNCPLDEDEVESVRHSAWSAAQGRLQKSEDLKMERHNQAVELLDLDLDEVSKAAAQEVAVDTNIDTDNPTFSGNGHAHHAGTPAGDASSGAPTVEKVLPESLRAAARLLGEHLIDSLGMDFIKKLGQGVRHKQYQSIAPDLAAAWRHIGSNRKGIVDAVVSGRTVWGAGRVAREKVSRDLGVPMLRSAINAAAGEGLRQSVPGFDRPMDSRALSACAGTAWDELLLEPSMHRQNPDVIVMQNGVYHLREQYFEVRARAPYEYSHPVAFNFRTDVAAAVNEGCAASAVVPTFCKYVQDWFPGDNEIIKVLLRFFGYCFTTDYSRQQFGFFYGPTRAGKGCLCRIAHGLVGEENYCSAYYYMLDGGFKSAEMHDKLIITVEEAEGTAAEHEKRMGQLKKMLGGEQLYFERKYAQPIHDYLIGKVIFQANAPLKYEDKGHSIRSRLLCVGFEQSFETACKWVEPDKEILTAEADALGTLMVLAWARGRELGRPFAVENCRALEIGTAEIAESIDVVGAILKKYCVKDGTAGVRSAALKLAVDIAVEIKEVPITGRVDVRIKQEMKMLFPSVKYSQNMVITAIKRDGPRSVSGHERQRGYVGVRFNLDGFVSDYETDSDESSLNLAHKLNELKELCL